MSRARPSSTSAKSGVPPAMRKTGALQHALQRAWRSAILRANRNGVHPQQRRGERQRRPGHRPGAEPVFETLARSSLAATTKPSRRPARPKNFPKERKMMRFESCEAQRRKARCPAPYHRRLRRRRGSRPAPCSRSCSARPVRPDRGFGHRDCSGLTTTTSACRSSMAAMPSTMSTMKPAGLERLLAYSP